MMPIAAKEKQAYIYYREGFAAQNNGDYSEALENYEESLKLEENAIDRGENIKIFGDNDFIKSKITKVSTWC